MKAVKKSGKYVVYSNMIDKAIKTETDKLKEQIKTIQHFDNADDMGAKNAESVSVDMKAMKQDIGQIKGVGASRLDEIMAVIEKHLMPSGETE